MERFETESRSVKDIKEQDFVQFAFDSKTKEQIIWQVVKIESIPRNWEDVKFKKHQRVETTFHNNVKITQNIRTKMNVVTDEIEFVAM